ncbi:hypothetical protein BN59_03510 [Legionella massiliensis]|uniref:Uncharacterized protein n=1 Tax=Legionella massiliensis TaxID=1034943 RepID=A0A078L1R5_9GAMM|nr:hypothetical protein [Legionella massiliensis]CDZ79192.1 hypothetical protein BN59_03510 [Legionella massiliensis]CEE14930.1 hypothetical protein BN1094_03510 [Legionella massiliensis]
MYYQDYLQNKALKSTLRGRLNKQRAVENAPITIRDLIVYPDDAQYSFGESNYTSEHESSADSVNRLTDHIKSLATIANLYHQQAYCEATDGSNYQLKAEYANTITRMSLCEFSLYAKKPLSLDEFSQIVENLSGIARNCHDNVHLLLSSFSVLDKHGKLLNVSIYLQGGENAKVDTVSKGTASAIDVDYQHTAKFSQQTEAEISSKVSSFVASPKATADVIPSNSILEIKTKGGAKYTQAIDVCYDHANHHSRRLLQSVFNAEVETTQFIPEQADHLVTANSVDIYESAKICPYALHVDPRPLLAHDPKNVGSRTDMQLRLSETVLAGVKEEKYGSMKLTQVPGRLLVKNPPFGASYTVKILQERKLGGYVDSLKPKVEAFNSKVMEKTVDSLVTTRFIPGGIDDEDFHQLEDTNARTLIGAFQLIKILARQAEPNIFEYFFNTESYVIKNQAKVIIDNAAQMLDEFDDSKKDFLVSSEPWLKDIQFRLSQIDNGFPYYFMYKMKSALSDFNSLIGQEMALEF